VRSLSSGWRKGSIIAVDAGVHLSAIARILHETQPPDLGETDELSVPHTLTSGPFAGLEVPFASADANAAHIHRNLIDTYLITHPHLDHISGFVINTAGLPGSRPKRLAGLPSTIAAFKTHIFNNVIWPNLSDENNGAGLVTYMRLVEGGSPALGEGEGRGYLEISEGLAVKVWGVSHGHCIEKHSHRGSGSSTRYGSMDATSMSLAIGPMGTGMGSNVPILSPRGLGHHNSVNPSLSAVFQQQQQRDQMQLSNSPQGFLPGSSAPSGGGQTSSISIGPPSESVCVYDSSAYFIRDVATGREVLIFGDVEPDSISLSPRNQQIWQEAAPKIASGKLAAIFIECSYDDSQTVDRLFGHLAPRFFVQEMSNLAEEVRAARRTLQMQKDAREAVGSQEKAGGPGSDKKKRKRDGGDSILTRRKAAQARSGIASSAASSSLPSSPLHAFADDPVSPKTVRPGRESSLSQAQSLPDDDNPMSGTPHLATPTAELTLHDVELLHSAPVTPRSAPPVPAVPFPLKGLKVVVIHMKDKLNDGPAIGEILLGELEEYEKEAQLGCEYVISSAGAHMYF
jgi:3',5'-cyclic-nucleotide phosphodiesterase